MIKEYNFRFDELIIDQKGIGAVLGYADGRLPEPFDQYLEEALNDALDLTDICAAYRILDEVVIDKKNHKIRAGDHEFIVGNILCNELKHSERLAFFVCTAGKTISEKSECLLKGDDPVLGYVYDVLGSAIAEATGNRMQAFLKREILKNGDLSTNRYSPGYCQWNVADQHKLFSFFHENVCGVNLTNSALMHPIKSISGVIGIGKEVKFRDYRCDLCSQKDCLMNLNRSNLNHRD